MFWNMRTWQNSLPEIYKYKDVFEILFLFQQTSSLSCAVYYFYFGPFAHFNKSHINVGHPAAENQLKLSVTILSYVFQNNEKTSCRKKRQDIL